MCRAMEGGMSYVDAFDRRMKILSPSLRDMKAFLAEWRPTLTSGIRPLMEQLQNDGKRIYLVSGGISDASHCRWSDP